MKTILFPIDYSKTSKVISEYAGQLAHEAAAEVMLVATNPLFAGVPSGDWDVEEEAQENLNEWRNWMSSQFRITCQAGEVILKNPYKKLTLLSDQYDLMILGLSKRKSKTFLPYAGLDLIKVIRETLIPIMIVPEKYEYKKINRLLYAYDYLHEPEPPLLQIRWLADWFDAEVKFLSILPEELPAKDEDKQNIVQDKISSRWKPGKQLTFDTIVYHNVSRCLEHYLSVWEANDLLVLSINHKNILEKIWHKSVVKGLLECGAHPYLILHR